MALLEIEGILASRRVIWHQARFRTTGFGADFRIGSEPMVLQGLQK